MTKRFRHRFQVAMYDNTPLDRDIIDYIASYDSSHAKQEFIRSLMRIGFSTLIKNRTSQQALMDGLDPETLAVAIQTLSAIYPTIGPVSSHMSTKEAFSREAPRSTNGTTDAKDESLSATISHKKEHTPSNAEPLSSQNLKNAERSENNKNDNAQTAFHLDIPFDDNRDMSGDIDDDDIKDPLSMFGGEGGLL